MAGPRFTPRVDPHAPSLPDGVLERLHAFGQAWRGRTGSEEQLSQSFLGGLCDALGVARPYDAAHATADYGFEKKVDLGGGERGSVDLYKRGANIAETKCGRNSTKDPGSAPVRGTKSYARYIEGAYLDQARVYADPLPEGPPPLVIVADIGERFWIGPRVHAGYAAFPSARRLEIPLAALHDEESARILRACFEDPGALDPARRHQKVKVSREAAEKLAALAASLGRRHAPEEVASFPMRALLCLFAEDVDLLPPGLFGRLLVRARRHPDHVAGELTDLFRVMDTGGVYDFEAIRRFNGSLFANAHGLPLTTAELDDLAAAAALDWALVEPALFGTLLERALDPAERRHLGAHSTPRAFVERLVRATIDEPLQAEWEVVRVRADEVGGPGPDRPGRASRRPRAGACSRAARGRAGGRDGAGAPGSRRREDDDSRRVRREPRPQRGPRPHGEPVTHHRGIGLSRRPLPRAAASLRRAAPSGPSPTRTQASPGVQGRGTRRLHVRLSQAAAFATRHRRSQPVSARLASRPHARYFKQLPAPRDRHLVFR